MAKNKLLPIADRVLIEENESHEPESRIVLTEEAEESLKGEVREGKVIAIGQDIKHVKVGWIVYYNNYNADPIKEFLLVKEDSVLAYRG